MKPALACVWLLAASTLVLPAAERSHRLQVEVLPRFAGAPLAFDAVTNLTAQGQRLSVTRLDFLLSNIALRRADGGWLGLTNWFAYLSAREGRTSFELNNLPAGAYDRLRLQVGVPPAINHADPAQFAATHPLNPNVNGLHWNWQGGYVFLAIEGNWRSAALQAAAPAAPTNWAAGQTVSSALSAAALLRVTDPRSEPDVAGYSYHIATDRHLMTVELPIELRLSTDHELRLALDVAKIFASTHTIALSDETASTHSREGDPLADQLGENIESAFTVLDVSPSRSRSPAHSLTGSPAMAPDATPYHLTISGFFPRPALPTDNPLTEEGVHLGSLLFFDPRLSINNSQSCASCHHPAVAFVDRSKAVSRGAEGQTGTRNSMPLFNLAWKSSFFWDGRAPTLREQVLKPIQDPTEMHETLENVVAKLKSARVNQRHEARALRSEIRDPKSEPDQSLSVNPPLTPGRGTGERLPNVSPLLGGVGGGFVRATPANPKDYLTLFARAFGTPEITPDRMARALEQFLLTQVSHDSKFDRVLRREVDFSPEEKRGFELFHTEYDPRRGQFGADCFHCHGGPLFQSQTFANNGLDAEPRDLGRFLASGKEGDRGKFAVPSLRNVALTAPYMHDGRFETLGEVIEHYTGGVKRSRTLDPNLAKHPSGGIPLAASDKEAIQAFLTTLTDKRWFGETGASRRRQTP